MAKQIQVVVGVDGADWYYTDTQHLFELPDLSEWSDSVWVYAGNFMSMDWRGHHLANVIRREWWNDPGTYYALRGTQEDDFLRWCDDGDDGIDIEELVFSGWGIPQRVADRIGLEKHTPRSAAWNNALRDFYLDFYGDLVQWLRTVPHYLELHEHVIFPMNDRLKSAMAMSSHDSMIPPASDSLGFTQRRLHVPPMSPETCGGLWWIDGVLRYQLPAHQRRIITYDAETQTVSDGRYREILPQLIDDRLHTWE